MLTLVQQYQYGTPVFIISNKEGPVRFIMDYRRINQKLGIKTYLLSIIGKTIQKLEGFQYATSLDINMGCNNIRILSASQYMVMIYTLFGKFRYNFLPMEICAFGDIFQAKLDNLLGDI